MRAPYKSLTTEEFTKPRVVLSKCIEFAECRYDAHMVSSDVVKKLMANVEFITVCPEVEIGLGTPRKPLRLVSIDGELKLLQPATNLDLTEKMQRFEDSFLDSLPEVDGFLLKRSVAQECCKGCPRLL